MIKYKCRELYVSLVFMLFAFNLSAQQCDSTADCYCHHAGTGPAGIMVGHPHQKGTWMVSYRYMFMNMKGTRAGTSAIADEKVFSEYLMVPTSMNMQMHMMMGMYGITDKLSLMGMLQFQTTAMHMNMFSPSGHHHSGDLTEPDNHMHMETSGLGDSKIYLSYACLLKPKHSIIVSGGLSIPTGNIQYKGEPGSMYNNTRLPYMMQAGSGTMDMMPGVTYNYSGNNWDYSLQATSVIRLADNSLGYHYGNEFVSTAWVSRRLLTSLNLSLRGEYAWVGKMSGKDATLFEGMEPAADARNYGGNRISSYMGCSYRLPQIMSTENTLSVEFGLPAYQDLKGIQQPTRFILNAAWLVSF